MSRAARRALASGANAASRACASSSESPPPEQLGLEALFAQLIELVEVQLERALLSAQFAPERAEMVEATRHQGREPAARFVLRLIELHRQIDIADLERAARIGTEEPDLAHPRHVMTLASHEALDKTAEPPRRLRAFHRGPDYCGPNRGLRRAGCAAASSMSEAGRPSRPIAAQSHSRARQQIEIGETKRAAASIWPV